MPGQDMTTERAEPGLLPAEQAVVIMGKIFDEMELKEDRSYEITKEKNLGDEVILQARNSKERADQFNVWLKKGGEEILVFSLNSQGLNGLRIRSFRTSLGGMTIKREGISQTEENLKGRQKSQEAALALVNWVSQMISENKYIAPPLQAEAELE